MDAKKKVLPIGEDDFRIIRESGDYYVDKTLMIKDFINYKNRVSLITRPRRFGKTLNMTMLRDFFDINQQSHDIFEGLAIMETEYAEMINTKPVIHLSFKGCSGDSVDDLKDAMACELLREYNRFAKIFKDNVDVEAFEYESFYEIYENLKNASKARPIDNRDVSLVDTGLFKRSLLVLTRAVSAFYVKPIVLIDEYDNPIIEAHQGNFRTEFTSFYASFLTKALKGNDQLGQALLTGIQRVAKESIFSKLNNVVVRDVTNKQYASYFGLTELETSELLEYYDLKLTDEVKLYYDGYNFAGVDIYNPWSILSYADEQELQSYWLYTSTNALIHEVVAMADYEFHKNFEKLIQQGFIEVSVNLSASFAELPETETLWGLFVNAGYLTVTNVDYEFDLLTVKIPNKEITKEFKKIVSGYTKLGNEQFKNMLIALTRGKMDEFLTIYRKLVLESTSYYDAKENAYHMLMLGMVMHLRELYDITSNIESGHGRSDLIMKSKDAKRSHIIIEFKQGEDVEKLKHEALVQIEENKYYAGLTGDILCVGVAHDKKRCEICHRMITV